MSLVIPDEVLQSARLTADELRQEIALLLFQQERFSLARAAEYCGCSRLAFQQLLDERGITIHYDVVEYDEDVATLANLKRP